MRRIKFVLAALAVAVASFAAFSGPAMAVECEHTNDPGVIECGSNDNVFLSEERFEDDISDPDFILDDGDVDDFVVDDFFLLPLFVIDDIDCDGEDDDGDGLFDEDAECVIELEPVEW